MPADASGSAPPLGSAAPRRLGRTVALRIDVCTFEGCRDGMPALFPVLARRGIRATFFVSMGPDRSGLAVLRVFRKKGFLRKMLRTKAGSMYGWRTALYGTLLPSPIISERCAEILRRADGEGHEVGIHGWDHVKWQDALDRLSDAEVREDYERAMDAYERVLGKRPMATGSPAWFASDRSLRVERELGFRFASDCRGTTPFLPVVDGLTLELPQVPITFPTLDEALGLEGQSADGFNDIILRSFVPETANVHTAHAEAEGRVYLPAFERFLDRAIEAGWHFVTQGTPRCASATASPRRHLTRPRRGASRARLDPGSLDRRGAGELIPAVLIDGRRGKRRTPSSEETTRRGASSLRRGSRSRRSACSPAVHPPPSRARSR
jgi:undecaprenyl phosphate-alpha-L-ara4FN deformylase